MLYNDANKPSFLQLIPGYERDMTDSKPPRGQHLYLFQDSSGLIKIGRSGDPAKRRRALATASGKIINIVLILPDRGCDEGMVMEAAAAHRRSGEWFDPSLGCREAIATALGVEINWPIPLPQYLKAWREEKDRSEIAEMVQRGVSKILSGPPRGRIAVIPYSSKKAIKNLTPESP